MGEIRQVLDQSVFHGEGYRKVWARLRHKGIRVWKDFGPEFALAVSAENSQTSFFGGNNSAVSASGFSPSKKASVCDALRSEDSSAGIIAEVAAT